MTNETRAAFNSLFSIGAFGVTWMICIYVISVGSAARFGA